MPIEVFAFLFFLFLALLVIITSPLWLYLIVRHLSYKAYAKNLDEQSRKWEESWKNYISAIDKDQNIARTVGSIRDEFYHRFVIVNDECIEYKWSGKYINGLGNRMDLVDRPQFKRRYPSSISGVRYEYGETTVFTIEAGEGCNKLFEKNNWCNINIVLHDVEYLRTAQKIAHSYTETTGRSAKVCLKT